MKGSQRNKGQLSQSIIIPELKRYPKRHIAMEICPMLVAENQ
jgi:hypothetical protein